MGLLSTSRNRDGVRRAGILDACERAAALGRLCCEAAARLALALATLGLLALGAAWLSVRHEAVEIPALAAAIEHEVNAGQDDFRLSVGSALIGLGRREGQPALRFRDVEVRGPEGDLLIAVPWLGARFHLPDLIEGRVRVTEMLIRGPSAQVVRGIDGRWRFGLGAGGTGGGLTLGAGVGGGLLAVGGTKGGAVGKGDGVVGAADYDEARGGDAPPGAAGPAPASGGTVGATPEPADEELAEDEAFAAVARILDGLAGDAAPVPALERLHGITIRDAVLTYRNAETGSAWATESATLRVRRDEGGLTAALGVDLEHDEGSPLRTIRVTLRRDRGAAATGLDASVRGVVPTRVAGGIPELDWLALIDAPIDGTLSGTLGDDGRLTGIAGSLRAEAGRFVAAGGVPLEHTDFDALRIDLDYDVGAERLGIASMAVEGRSGSAELSGFMDLERDGSGALGGLAAQLTIHRLALDLPGYLAEPVLFDGGEVAGRVSFRPAVVDIASVRLSRDALGVELSGRLTQSPDGWAADLRAEGRNLSVDGLKRFWPLPFAGNARKWVVENLRSGMIDSLVAQVRSGEGEPQVSLDFRFRDVVSAYLGDMPVIAGGAGRGHLRLHEFFLELDRGEVVPIEGSPVALGGSAIRISELWGRVTPADIDLRGAGELRSILTLIDREPLRLVSKLGLDPGAFEGQARVETALGFPLIRDLRLDEVMAEATGVVTDLGMTLDRAAGDPLDIRSGRVVVAASTRELTVSGDVVADGVPATVDWREVYGADPSRREIVLRGRVTPALLSRLGGELPSFEGGSAGIVLRLSQDGAEGPTAFVLDAELADAALAIPDLGWAKAPGPAARLAAEGQLGQDGGLDIARLDLDAPGLAAQGGVGVGPSGEIERASFSRLRLGEQADLALEAVPVGEGGMSLTLRGRFLDLDALDDVLTGLDDAGERAAAGAPPTPPRDLTVDFDIERVVLTPRIAVSPARGSVTRADGGPVRVDLIGDVNGEAPVRATLALPAEGDGRLTLATRDAGSFLRATGLAEAARDGTLDVDAVLRGGSLDSIAGTATLTDVTLREAETFERILRQGGVERSVTVESGGLSFSEVRIPFEYRDGIITLGTSIATSPALAVKLEGTIVEETGALDLSGVISPAYAVTGALNNIPLLGALLSGGKGEGILAMTFSVGGTIDDPSYSVNPLSLLAPGFLRRIFTSKVREPDERFLEGLERGE